jgi:teichuronic acid biosynthesis glycosyltransferase TuaH
MIKNREDNLLTVNENLWELYPTCILENANWLPSTFLFRIVNNNRLANEIKKAIVKLNFKDFILFNDSDMFRSFHLPEMLKPTLSVYYIRDNMMSVPY